MSPLASFPLLPPLPSPSSHQADPCSAGPVVDVGAQHHGLGLSRFLSLRVCPQDLCRPPSIFPRRLVCTPLLFSVWPSAFTVQLSPPPSRPPCYANHTITPPQLTPFAARNHAEVPCPAQAPNSDPLTAVPPIFHIHPPIFYTPLNPRPAVPPVPICHAGTSLTCLSWRRAWWTRPRGVVWASRFSVFFAATATAATSDQAAASAFSSRHFRFRCRCRS